VDLEIKQITPPLADEGALFDDIIQRACSVLPGYATDELGARWSSCMQKDSDRVVDEAAVTFTLQRIESGGKPASVDYENSLKYMVHSRQCNRGELQPWPSKGDWRFTYRVLIRNGKCPEGIDVFHRSGGTRPF
jgi:hypothetical protein